MIGKLIARERKRLGLSCWKLAREAGVALQTVKILEQGAKAPKLATLRAVLGALGLKAELVLTVDGRERRIRL